MSGNCKCDNCCPKKCENPCLLLSEPYNPCTPKQITFCVPQPYDPCNPYNTCDSYNSCDPYNQSTNTYVNPTYVVNNSIMGGNGTTSITLTTTQVNCNNFLVFNPTNGNLVITLPLISTLNNQKRKSLYLVNLSIYKITLKPANSGTNADNLNGLTTSTIEANDTLVIHSLPGISSGTSGSVWALNQ